MAMFAKAPATAMRVAELASMLWFSSAGSSAQGQCIGVVVVDATRAERTVRRMPLSIARLGRRCERLGAPLVVQVHINETTSARALNDEIK